MAIDAKLEFCDGCRAQNSVRSHAGMGLSKGHLGARAAVLASALLVHAILIPASRIVPVQTARSTALADQVTDPQDLEKDQGYLDPAPGGMDVRYAWAQNGGRGQNVKIIDI